MFNCSKCGICCRLVGRSKKGVKLDRGDGVCKHFDENTNLCTIYFQRPLECNVDNYFEEKLFGKISRDDYYRINYQFCRDLQILYKNGV